MSAPQDEVEAAGLRWRTGEGTILLILYGSLIAVLCPAFFYVTRFLPGSIHDSLALRIDSVAFSLALMALVMGIPAVRPVAHRLQLANIAVFFMTLMIVLIQSRNNNSYVLAVVIALFGAQYAFLRWQELVAAYVICLGFEAVYSAYNGLLTAPSNLYAMGVVLASSIVCIAVGALRLRTLYAQVNDRIRLELQAHDLSRQTEQIAHLAYSDGLTGLLNRTGLNDRIERTLAIGRRHRLRSALLYLDLDGFKSVNDDHGHDAGDAVLIETALRIQYLLRNGETFARIGGDEFIVLMPIITSRDAPRHLAARIEESFVDPYYLHETGNSVNIGVSIGYAVYPEDGASRLELLARADQRMYEVKHRRSEIRRAPA